MSWLDLLPSSEKSKVRKKLRSPETYEKLREKVKGPEALEQEMEKNEAMAELKFALETEPAVQEKLQQQIEHDVKEEGIENLVDIATASPDALQAIEAGNFTIAVESTDEQEQIVLYPEGNVQEKLPLQTHFSDRFL